MGVSIGTHLGSYEITALLGKGGMGEVYRARDSKLKREVAIKILPDEFASDPMRIGRFQREAEVVAALNHPNIAAIYDVQEHADCRFLVLELVEGETLAQRIAHGPIPVDEALNIAKQICEALETAHEKGIVHRDLKPANVKIQPDGKVKVLDFGLAKAIENRPADAAMSHSPTLSLAATNAGVIIGTAAYMSPEQARGFEADHRSDIFALGCVIYEMLTGRQGFQGDTVSDVLASVLKVDPELSLLPSKLNPKIRELLRRCLEKNPKRRWHAVGDVRVEIESALVDPFGAAIVEAVAAVPAKPLWKRVASGVSLTILGAALASFAAWALRPASTAVIVTRFAFPLAEGQQFTNSGRKLVAISPDGTQMVYIANQRLFLRRMGELEAKVIPGSESQAGLYSPVFSPDGGSIAFYSGDDNNIKRIAVSGGAAITICPVTGPVPYGLDWSEQGILFGKSGDGIMRVSPNGDKPETVVTTKDEEVASNPQMLPGGDAVLFSFSPIRSEDRWDKAQIVVQRVGSAERKILVEGGSDGHYVSTGYLVYAFSGTLRALPFDVKRLEVTGGAVSVLEGVRRSTGPSAIGLAHFSFSNNGSLVYVPGPVSVSSTMSSLAVTDIEGRAQQLKVPTGAYIGARVSPNGKQVAAEIDDSKEAIISIYDLDGSTSLRRLTFGGKNRAPLWSPDGNWITFQSDREGDAAIYRQRADGTGTAERLTKPEAETSHIPDSWSPNGDTLLFESRKGATASLMAFSLRDKKTSPFGNIQNTFSIDALFSPDGHWVAYSSRETGKNEIFVQPFPATGAKFQIPKNSDNHDPVWSRDGKELVYVTGPSRFAAISVSLQPNFAVGNAVDVFKGADNNHPSLHRNFDLMPDGKHVIGITGVGPDQAGSPSTPQIQVILNWFDDLKRRVPTNR